jgi:hypothetical protein
MISHSDTPSMPYLFRAQYKKSKDFIYFNEVDVEFGKNFKGTVNTMKMLASNCCFSGKKAFVITDNGRKIEIDPKTLNYFDGIETDGTGNYFCSYK